jgi:glycosyltransferase involved in cell wall biosynthesis
VPKGRNHAGVGSGSAGGSAGRNRRGAAVAAASGAAGGAVARLRNPGRVLWWSNAPWAATGYGTQTAAVTRRLRDAGYPTAIAANFGFAGGVTEWDGMPVLPQGFEGHSQDVMFAHWDAWRAEQPGPCPMITLYDTWVLKQPRLAEIPVIGSWVPVDHLPAPPDVVAWCAKPNVVPIAMARFGQELLERAGVTAWYVPHGVDTNVFRPGAKLPDGRSGRALYGAEPDRFVIMMNAANKGTLPNRKAFAENLLAVSELVHRTGGPDATPVLLYMHTEPNNGIGINLFDLLQAVGIPQHLVRWVDSYAYRNGLISDEYLAALTASANVLLATSRGEGFGIPALEAQACGTRVIVSDFSAQPELVGDGWCVDGQPEWDPFQKAWFHTPRVAGIVDALEAAFDAPREPSAKAVAHAAGYDHDLVFDRDWRPVLDELMERATALEPVS